MYRETATRSAHLHSIHCDGDGRVIMLNNGRLELAIELKHGQDRRRLTDCRGGKSYADREYVWKLDARPSLIEEPRICEEADGSKTVRLRFAAGFLHIEQTYALPAGEPGVLAETIRLTNVGDCPLDTSAFACGFGKPIRDGANWLVDPDGERWCNVPYRRNSETGELCEYSIAELTTRESWYSTVRSPTYNLRFSPLWGAEGWAWYAEGNVLLVHKYNPDQLEWSLVDPDHRSRDNEVVSLRFGGAGMWKLGDPEGAASLAPGASFAYGETRYAMLDGDWRNAYADFRRYNERKGHVTPAGYNPPVHWNEIYDNPLWWTEDTPENRRKYYQKADMLREADKAQEMGCECLYLDPGWDTSLGSFIWSEDRLGSQAEFASMLKERYGMALALHTPLAPWSDADAYPPEARRMKRDGVRHTHTQHDQSTNVGCSSSPAYLEAAAERLLELCRNGACFLMYDGSWFAGECYDPGHGHALPQTRQDHLDSILRLQQRIHAEYPNVVIEQHDPIVGPGTNRYAPTYFMHAKPGAFDVLWGFEYMIDPLDDMLSKRAFSLYYVNLAYSIPVYLHVDLRKDNENALMFWWYASTCRHLGIGGKSADAKIWEAQKKAMATYKSLKRFYAQGTFHGLDETVHAHSLADAGACVIDFFNLESRMVQRNIRFKLAEIGLTAGNIAVEGAGWRVNGDELSLNVVVQAMSHAQVKLQVGRTVPLHSQSGG